MSPSFTESVTTLPIVSALMLTERLGWIFPLAVFGMGPDSLEDSKVVESRKQLDRSLAATPELEPVAVTIFRGALMPETWRFPFSRLPAFDARDWDAIEEWTDEVAASISLVAV